MDESVVERSIDVGNAEYELALADLRSKLDSGFLCNTCFFRWLYPNVSNPIHQTVGQIKLDCMCSSTCDKNDRDAPSSKASEYEKLELNVRRVRELTAPIRVWASASIPNTRTQISHLAMRAIMMPRYVALDKVYFDLVMDASLRSALSFCHPHFHVLSLLLTTLSSLSHPCGSSRRLLCNHMDHPRYPNRTHWLV